MTTSPRRGGRSRAGSWLHFAGVVAGLYAGGWLLYATAGPPRLPPALPTWHAVTAFLKGSDVPWDALGYLLSTAAWLVLAWLATTLLLRVLLAAAEVAGRGAAWVRALRAASDRITLPLVRRAVDGALVVSVVVTLAGRASPAVAAGYPPPLVTVTPPDDPGAAGSQLIAIAPPLAASAAPAHAQAQASPLAAATRFHQVVPNDNLWSLARQYYGAGDEYPRIVAANIGHRMADGRTFTHEGVIQPGWLLEIPPAPGVVEAVDGERFYVVQDSDSLSGIAARVLQDESRWRELFALNRGVAAMPDGRLLTHENLIWPGLRLKLPAAPLEEPGTGEVAPASAQALAGDVAGLPPDEEEPASVPSAATVAGVTTDAADQLTPSAPADWSDPVAADDQAQSANQSTPFQAPAGAAGAFPPTTNLPPTGPSHPTRDALAIAGLASVTAVVVAAHRRFRRSLKEPPVPDEEPAAVPVVEGFAVPDAARGLATRAGAQHSAPDVLAAQVLRALHAADVAAPSLIGVALAQRPSGLAADVTVRTTLADQPKACAVARELGSRLGGRGEASVNADHELVIRLSRVKPVSLLLLSPASPMGQRASAASEAGEHGIAGAAGPARTADRSAPPLPLLIPVAVLPGHRTLYVNWHEVGHVLLASTVGGGAPTVLASLVACLLTPSDPAPCRLLLAGNGRSLPLPLAALVDEPSIQIALLRTHEELRRRIRKPDRARPLLVQVIGELADVDGGDAVETLHAIAVHGPTYGIQLLAATTRAEEVPDGILEHFNSRLVFQTAEEEQSVLLLGTPDAADLGEGGNVLLRIDGRLPVRARGFRVADEQWGEIHAAVERTRLDGSSSEPAAAAPCERLPAASSIATPAPVAAPATVGGDAPPSDRLEGSHPARPGKMSETSEKAAAHVPAAPSMHVTQDESGPANVPPAAIGAHAAHADGSPTGTEARAGVPFEEDVVARPPGAEAVVEEPMLPPARLVAAMASAAATSDREGRPDRLAAEPAERAAVRREHKAPAERGEAVATLAAATPNWANVSARPEREPPIRVRCFGDLEVSTSGQLISAETERRKYFQPLEILALVASRPPAGVSKEQVLTLLWPETTERRGAKRLSVTLVRLRDLLELYVPGVPASVVRCDRNKMCRLDPSWIWSDVQAFLALVEEGRCAATDPDRREEGKAALARAHALYRGDLLTNPYYEWVHDRGDGGATLRERYRERYQQATFALAQLYGDDGEDAKAVPLLRTLLRLEPTLEEATRHLYRCYERLGDRKAVILEDRRLRQAIRAAMTDPAAPVESSDDLSKYQPVDETMAVYDEVLASLSRRSPTPAVADASELVAAGD